MYTDKLFGEKNTTWINTSMTVSALGDGNDTIVTSEQKTTPPNDFTALLLSKRMIKRTNILLLTVLAHVVDVNTEVG